MYRNTQSHFAELPTSQLQRSTFLRPSSYKTSFNSGSIIPFYLDEIVPGDTFDVTTSKVIRSQTMLTPVMDSIWADFYYFFCPTRLVWDHWEEFCGENKQGAWAPTVEYNMPTIAPPEGGFAVGTIADYMGLPVGVEWDPTDPLAPSALPLRAYALICNEFFRDENLTDPLLIPTGDANQQGVNTGNYISDVANGGLPFVAAKQHDVFTSALPSPQKGSPVGIPLTIPQFAGGIFPVSAQPNVYEFDSYNGLALKSFSGSWTTGNVPNSNTVNSTLPILTTTSNGEVTTITSPGSSSFNVLSPVNLAAVIPDQNISTDDTEVSFSVNELRLAFAYQRFLEALARSGSRYTELIQGLYGVRSPDARLQRPEYLGGNRVPINVSEVTNNAQTATDFLGDLGAKSQTADVHHDFVKSFSEFGYVLGLMVVRYDHSYSQGLQRLWTRKSFTDYYNPKFANLGEMPVYEAEIYANNNFTKDDVFGYQEAWFEYRYKPNMVTGEMRPGVPNSLAYWHLSDYYTEAPTLSDSWIREDKTNVDRVLSVTSEVSHQFWCDIFIQNKSTRCMPMYSVPGLIDHF